jgi:hydrogenase maturation protein HypF
MVDNGLKGEVIGVAFDGTGYGCDGNIWGGEFFVGSLRGFKRAAHLRYIPMPGGEAVVKEPRRMAAAYLYKTIGEDALTWMDRRTWKVLKTMIDRRINSPLTSSVGRLFDAAASLILAKDFAAKEAEGPMELERVSDASVRGSYDFEIAREGDMLVLDAARTMRGLMKEPFARVAAAKFHNTVAEMIASSCKLLRRRHHVKKVVLSGGVFQNRLLLKKARELLAKSDFKIYSSVNVPTNDSGIPIGQAAIANARCR